MTSFPTRTCPWSGPWRPEHRRAARTACAWGLPWVHLRLCLTCGHVGCCDSSPMRHARAHAATDGHPIVRSFEPGEDWRWCFVHEAMV